MPSQIKIRRGLKANLPALAVGELGFATDTGELYIGTASGNVKLAPSESGGAVAPMSPTVWRPSTNYYYAPGVVVGDGLTDLTLTANRIYVYPFSFDQDISLTSLAVQITAAASGKSLQAGIYTATNSSGMRKPYQRIDYLETETDATGLYTMAGSWALTGGQAYFIAIQSDGTPGLRAAYYYQMPPLFFYLSGATSARPNSHLYYSASSYGLPSDLSGYSFTPGGNASVPLLFMR